MKIDKSNPFHWLLLLQQGCYTLLAICLRPFRRRKKRPVVVLYGHQLSGNLRALYEQWHQTHRDKLEFYFLSLDSEYSETLANQGVRVLRCSRLRDMIFVGRCDAMITDHGLHAMSPLVRVTDIKFIDVWHGIPFKRFVPDDFHLQHHYDEVWVSSPLLKTIYEDDFGFTQGNVSDMGYARTDKLFRGESPTNDYRSQVNISKNSKLVLYAPTWQQDDNGHELFPFGENPRSFITALSEVCARNSASLVIRSHLNARISEDVLANVYYCPMKDFPDTESLLLETDVLICDWSSIAFDYLALNRPAIFLDAKPPYRNGLSLGPEYRYGEVVGNMGELTDNLAEILTDTAGYNSRHQSTHVQVSDMVYGPNKDGAAAQRQLDRLAKIIYSPV